MFSVVAAARWLSNPAGELFWRTKDEEDEDEDEEEEDPTLEAISLRQYDLCKPLLLWCCWYCSLLGGTEEDGELLTLQVDSDVTDDESPEKQYGDLSAAVLNSRSAPPPMTESTAVARSEPGAEPYRVRPDGPMGFWECEGELEWYM